VNPNLPHGHPNACRLGVVALIALGCGASMAQSDDPSLVENFSQTPASSLGERSAVLIAR
jgi:hypothetical protein